MFWFIQIKMSILKELKLRDITYQKILLKIITWSSTERTFFGQPIDSDVKRYQEIRKMTTGYGKYYTTECSLDYEYVKNHYEIIAADVEKELDADPKTIQEIKLVGQLINPDNAIVDNEFKFVLTLLEKKLWKNC